MLNKGLVKVAALILECDMMATFVSKTQLQVFNEHAQFTVTFDNGWYTIEGVSFHTCRDIQYEPCNKESLIDVVTLLTWGLA